MLKRGLHCFPRIVVFCFYCVPSWRLSNFVKLETVNTLYWFNYKINMFFRVSTEKNIGTLFMWLIATTPDDFKAENVDL